MLKYLLESGMYAAFIGHTLESQNNLRLLGLQNKDYTDSCPKEIKV